MGQLPQQGEERVDDWSGLRVVAVDDHAAWRRFIVEHLGKPLVQIVGTAVDGLEAIQRAQSLQPDVMLMDIAMPRLNGLEATRAISAIARAVRILIVTNTNDPAIVQAAFEAGARGYALKSFVVSELKGAVETIIGGGLFVGRNVRHTIPISRRTPRTPPE